MPTPDKQLSAEQSRQIAGTIREEIARRRISRQSLAELAKLSLSTLEKVLGGRRPFTLATTVRLEQALGVALRKLPAAPGHWPWATFCANVLGALALGWFATRLQERLPLSAYRRPLLGTGLCGGLSTFSTMQVELLNRRRWRTRVELANAIFEHLEIFHNRQRRHSSLGMLTPIEFEKMHAYPLEVA